MSKPRQRLPKLNRDRLIEAALRVIDEDGVEKLTVRGVAATLDVTPMALYWHFAGKGELLDGVGDALAERLDLSSVSLDGPWDDRLSKLMHLLIDALAAHPGAAEITMRRLLYTETGKRFVEIGLSALNDAGLSEDDALLVGRYALRAGVAVAAEPVFTGIELSSERASQLQLEFEEQAATVSDRDFPSLRRMSQQLQAASDAESYRDISVRLLVGGIRELRAGASAA